MAALVCLGSWCADAGNKVVVYSVNYPLQHFAGCTAGEYAEVRFPVPADLDTALWKPDAQTVSQYKSPDLMLLNGAGDAA
ncbi:MAG: hypothetical protein JSU62_12570 [Gammaproteobacteria bacterium]|nr:MAG: hypothetical protein JSU62_12570 [Gammaproteobacteria bacterium]